MYFALIFDDSLIRMETDSCTSAFFPTRKLTEFPAKVKFPADSCSPCEVVIFHYGIGFQALYSTIQSYKSNN